jgi:PKHD-type hydroxylase
MLLRIPNVLTGEQVARFRSELDKAEWVDGKVTAGPQSAKAKDNLQLPESHPTAAALGDEILNSLQGNALFIAGALPQRVFPPLFNRYKGGQAFGVHVDNSIRQVTGTPHRIRTDLSATLFLSQPDEYDGGELLIEDRYGASEIKLSAGSMVLYPGTSLHQVRPVTRGERICSFFWIQSMVRDDFQRTLLFDLDSAIQHVGTDLPNHPSSVQLTGVYHNLLRQWADV